MPLRGRNGKLARGHGFGEKVGSMLSIDATRVLLGAVLLTLGRRLFWLFVGAVGFVAGMRFSEQFLKGYPDDTLIIFSIIVGVVFACMALTLRKFAVGGAGFLAGGYFLVRLLAVSGQDAVLASAGGSVGQLAPWVLFLVGGVIGAVLMNFVFNWTLIVLSAMGGSALVCESIHASPQIVSVVFTVLVIVGIVLQSGVMRQRRTAA